MRAPPEEQNMLLLKTLCKGEDDELKMLLFLANQSPLEALNGFEQQKMEVLFKRSRLFFYDQNDLMERAKELSEFDDFAECLDDLLKLLYLLLIKKNNPENQLFSKYFAFSSLDLVQEYSYEKIYALLDMLFEVKKVLSRGTAINKQMFAESLLISLNTSS